MSGKRMALMATGQSEGQNRTVEAAQMAISSPLLEETSVRGARRVLINITATRDSLRLQEVDQAAKIIEEIAGAEDTIFGAVYDEKMEDRIKITVIATGFNHNGKEDAWDEGERMHAPNNVISLASSESGKPIDYQLASIRENLDEPAFRRRRAE